MEVNQAIQLLELPDDFDEKDLEKAFRKKSLESHPDRLGGNKELFQELNEAFTMLKELPDMSDIMFMHTMFTELRETNDFNQLENDGFLRNAQKSHCNFQDSQKPNVYDLLISKESEDIIKMEPITYTIPITYRDYYYNKKKKISVMKDDDTKVSLVYSPCDDRTYYKEDNIVFKTRLSDDDNMEYTIIDNLLTRIIQINLNEFLNEPKLKIKVFNEEIEIERDLEGVNKDYRFISERDFTILVPNSGFYIKDSLSNRDNLLVKIIIVMKKIENNKTNI
jgi:DnaJ-class molecular chaperone